MTTKKKRTVGLLSIVIIIAVLIDGLKENSFSFGFLKGIGATQAKAAN